MPTETLDRKALRKASQIIKALQTPNSLSSPEELIEKAFLQGKFSSKAKSRNIEHKPVIFYNRTHEIYSEFNDSLEEPTSSLFSSKSYREFSSRLISNFPKIEIGASAQLPIKRKREEEPIQVFETAISKSQHRKIKPAYKSSESLDLDNLFRKAVATLETKAENAERTNNYFTNKIKKERSGDWFSPLDSLKDENRKRFKIPEPAKKTKLSLLEVKRSFDPHLLTQLETMRMKLDVISKEYQQESWLRKLIEELSNQKLKNKGRSV